MDGARLNETVVLARIRRFNGSLDRLMRFYTGKDITTAEFTKFLTAETAKQLGVQRVGIWTLDETQTYIDCVDLYQSSLDEHSNGLRLYAKDFPNYFSAVLAERVISADDAAQDTRTAEFKEVYLEPNNIISMLDAQIRSAAGPRGVICIETVGVRRDWSPDEIAYAVSAAEFLGIFMDREDRTKIHTELKNANERLAVAAATTEEARERYDLAMRAASDGIWDVDLLAKTTFMSDQNFLLLGEEPDHTQAGLKWWSERVHPDDRRKAREAYQSHIATNAPYNETYRIRHSDGSWRKWHSRGYVVRDNTGKVIRVVGTNSDVTDLVAMQTELEKRNAQLLTAQREIEDSALRDALTDLPNRRYVDRFFDDILALAEQKNRKLSVLHIDLDYFKEVNDSHGHAVGDATIKRVTSYLQTLLEPDDFIGRIGGDEFMAILMDGPEARRAIAFCRTLKQLLDMPLRLETTSVELGASIGIAVHQNAEVSVWDTLRDADLALYSAKRGGRRTHRVFTEKLREDAEIARQAKEDLLLALKDGDQFVPYFQPQFEAKTLDIVGFEVLVRWQHPTRGLLMPADFLDLATELGVVAEIDRHILHAAMSVRRSWLGHGFDHARISVNVSSDRLADPTLVNCVKELGEDAKLLSFELLETTLLDTITDQVSSVLRNLRRLGVQFEIDDFGSGYASIVSLLNVQPSRLKIDRSLTKSAHVDPAMSVLMRSIVDIARALKIEVVAEGVESKSQLAKLTAIGCDIFQGYHLGRPMSSDDVISTFSKNVRHSQRRARAGS